MTVAYRVDGFAPIEDYAVLGDGRTVALLASDGGIDWWPFPTLDSPPVVAAVLDPDRGGCLTVAPSGDYQVARRYLDDTNVVETVYTTGSGVIRVTAALNVGSAGRLPWTELAQRIEGLAGAVDVRWGFVPGDRFGRADPWITEYHGIPMAYVDDQTIGVLVDGVPPAVISRHRGHRSRHHPGGGTGTDRSCGDRQRTAVRAGPCRH